MMTDATGMGEILTRKIGNLTAMIRYDDYHKDARKYAIERLDKEEAAYLDAVEIANTPVNVLVDELERTHLISEDINQKTCANCGHQALVERKSRMRVFGGLFWTNSEPSPFKKCLNCNHEQEYNQFRPPHRQSLIMQAERRIERAKKLKARYDKPAHNKEKP